MRICANLCESRETVVRICANLSRIHANLSRMSANKCRICDKSHSRLPWRESARGRRVFRPGPTRPSRWPFGARWAPAGGAVGEMENWVGGSKRGSALEAVAEAEATINARIVRYSPVRPHYYMLAPGGRAGQPSARGRSARLPERKETLRQQHRLPWLRHRPRQPAPADVLHAGVVPRCSFPDKQRCRHHN